MPRHLELIESCASCLPYGNSVSSVACDLLYKTTNLFFSLTAYCHVIGINPLLFAFLKATKNTIKPTEDSAVCKYTILTSLKNDDFRTNISFSQMFFSLDVRPRVYARTFKGCMHVRPKGVWTYVVRRMDVRAKEF